eukprot:scaffold123748_cov32-Tisochrysis_lutea.AAC.1
MPCGGSAAVDVDEELVAAQKLSKKIDKEMKAGVHAENMKKKMLLLGAGESGKSTIFKQMQVITSGGYTKQELASFKWIIHRNVLDAIQILVRQAGEFGIPLAEENEERAEKVELWEGENINPELAEEISILWKDPGIQICFERRAEFQLGDASKYFLEAVSRIGVPDFVPTEEDVLHARVRTSGVVSKEFLLSGSVDRTIELFDVGGQRSERRRWIHYFDHVDSIIFVAAISEYDQVLAEDDSKNRLEEALDLFEQIVSSHHFDGTSVYLFLNKRDLFAEKIRKVDPKSWFPDYKGGCDHDAAADFFKKKFQERMDATKSTSPLYMHMTCATDTGNIKFVLDAIFEDEMQQLGVEI